MKTPKSPTLYEAHQQLKTMEAAVLIRDAIKSWEAEFDMISQVDIIDHDDTDGLKIWWPGGGFEWTLAMTGGVAYQSIMKAIQENVTVDCQNGDTLWVLWEGPCDAVALDHNYGDFYCHTCHNENPAPSYSLDDENDKAVLSGIIGLGYDLKAMAPAPTV